MPFEHGTGFSEAELPGFSPADPAFSLMAVMRHSSLHNHVIKDVNWLLIAEKYEKLCPGVSRKSAAMDACRQSQQPMRLRRAFKVCNL